MTSRSLLAALATSTALVAAPALAQDCADPIKVGVLHSLSGQYGDFRNHAARRHADAD